MPECTYQVWATEGSQKVENHTTQNHSQRVLEKISSVPMGEGMKVFNEGIYRQISRK